MKELLEDLKGENNHAFGQLYSKYFEMVHRFVARNSGQTDDAEDLFQDTMIVLVGKLRQDDFRLTASLKTYIMAIARNLWLKKLRSSPKEIALQDLCSTALYAEISSTVEQERTYRDKLQNLLHRITEHCRGLIHDIFFKEKAIEQIQEEYGYSTRHNAQNQKHKCIEQIKKAKEKKYNPI